MEKNWARDLDGVLDPGACLARDRTEGRVHGDFRAQVGQSHEGRLDRTRSAVDGQLLGVKHRGVGPVHFEGRESRRQIEAGAADFVLSVEQAGPGVDRRVVL